MENRAAAGQNPVSQHGAQLSSARRETLVAGRDTDLGTVVTEVGEDRSSTQVDITSENRVANIVLVGGSGPGQEDRPLDLRMGADDTAVTDPVTGSQIGAGPDLDIATDPDRAFDDGTRIDSGTGADGDAIADQMSVGGQGDFNR